jgi:DNA-directed RNA polymerase specialized sigma subunit
MKNQATIELLRTYKNSKDRLGILNKRLENLKQAEKACATPEDRAKVSLEIAKAKGDLAMDTALVKDVENCILHLNEERKQVLKVFFLDEERDLFELGEILGKERSAVYKERSLALRQLGRLYFGDENM